MISKAALSLKIFNPQEKKGPLDGCVVELVIVDGRKFKLVRINYHWDNFVEDVVSDNFGGHVFQVGIDEGLDGRSENRIVLEEKWAYLALLKEVGELVRI
jgi:hypothetical protein